MPSIQANMQAGKEAREKGTLIPAVPPPQLKPVPVADFPAAPNSYSRGPLPSTYVDRADTQRHFQTGAVPQARIPPLSATSNAIVGAQAASQAIQVVKTTTNTSSSGPLVSLQIPNIFTPTLQTESPTGLLAFTLAPESPHNFFAGPAPSAALYVDASNTASTSSGTISTTATPTQSATDFAMVFTAQDGTAGETVFNPGGAWSSIFASGTSTAFTQQLASFNPVTPSGSTAPASSWTSSLVLFGSNGAASVLHVNNLASGNFGSGSAATPSNTAGSTLILVRYSTVLFGTVPSITAVTDTQGNQWFSVVVSAGNLSGSGTAIAIWFAPNAVGGANTITWTQTGGNTSGNMEYFEVSNLTGFPGLPAFRPITGSDLPLPTAISIGAVYSKAAVTHDFLTSLGTDGRFVQAQPDFTDLTGNIAVAQMNSGTGASARTVFKGNNTWATLPEFSVDLFTQGSNVGLSTLGNPGVTGLYRISVHVIINAVATNTSTLPDCQISWTDGNNATAQTVDFESATPSANTLTTQYMGTAIVYVAGGVATVQYQLGNVTPYATNGATNMTYNVHLRMEAL